MEKITKYFTYTNENDTTIEYVVAGSYSALNCSFTGEDPAYGTDTIHFTAESVLSIEELAFRMLTEVKSFLDYRDGQIDEPIQKSNIEYDGYSLETLPAIETALYEITKDYHPKKWYATVREAGEKIATALIEDRTRKFSFSDNDDRDSAWYGIKRIDGDFDNDASEFIVVAGYYGGGSYALGYVDYDNMDTFYADCSNAVVEVICKVAELNPDDLVSVEEEG